MGRGQESARRVGRWAQVAALGPLFAGSVVIGYLAGHWLDRRCGSAPWFALAGMGLGIAAGVRELRRVLRWLRDENGGRSGVRARLRKRTRGRGRAEADNAPPPVPPRADDP